MFADVYFGKLIWLKDGTQGSGYWNDEGCLVIRSNRSHTECKCIHLTNFAILMDTVGVEVKIKLLCIEKIV